LLLAGVVSPVATCCGLWHRSTAAGQPYTGAGATLQAGQSTWAIAATCQRSGGCQLLSSHSSSPGILLLLLVVVLSAVNMLHERRLVMMLIMMITTDLQAVVHAVLTPSRLLLRCNSSSSCHLPCQW
jgi:asparagine N-glycosylation enzyme membrane subunit Stt3